jgi:hypothetical protein
VETKLWLLRTAKRPGALAVFLSIALPELENRRIDSVR